MKRFESFLATFKASKIAPSNGFLRGMELETDVFFFQFLFILVSFFSFCGFAGRAYLRYQVAGISHLTFGLLDPTRCEYFLVRLTATLFRWLIR